MKKETHLDTLPSSSTQCLPRTYPMRNRSVPAHKCHMNCARLVGSNMNKRPIWYGFREAPIIDLVWCAHGLEHLFKKLLKFLQWPENWVFSLLFLKFGLTCWKIEASQGFWYQGLGGDILFRNSPPPIRIRIDVPVIAYFPKFSGLPSPEIRASLEKIKSLLKGLCEFRLVWKNLKEFRLIWVCRGDLNDPSLTP